MTETSQGHHLRSLEECYRTIHARGPGQGAAESLLAMRDWFYSLTDFDPRSGEMLPSSLSELCARFSSWTLDLGHRGPRDRLHRVVEHLDEVLPELVRGLSSRPLREHGCAIVIEP